MPSVITDLNQVTPEWITQALRHSGNLPSGEVTCLRAASESSYTSTVVRLAVTYSDDAPPMAPHRLFLKLARLDSQQRVVGSTQRRREVKFHNKVAEMMPHAPVARCYQAVYCPETGAAHLLFDDVSETHFGGSPAIVMKHNEL
ncbi:MAG: hypothetical protein M1546_22915 [Chloroflexi bacterium]|nr:hypothetical protein [Chloroflexota bacterium]